MKLQTLVSSKLSTIREMPIREKLLAILLVTMSTALLLAGLGVVAAETLLSYSYLRQDLASLTQMIGENTTGALAFEDAQSASETLAVLRARTNVVAACLYRRDGSVIARYNRQGAPAVCPPPEGPQGISTGLLNVHISNPVLLRDRPIGTLLLIYDLREIYLRAGLYGIVVVAVLLAASAIALMLSTRLRAMIVTPLLALESTTSTVARSKDYGIRAQRLSNDEVGRLVDSFNEMLASIQSRDTDLNAALEAQREALNRHAQLNDELKRSNEELARSNEDLERFAFVASHDMQEPMRTITAYSQLLVREHSGNLDPQASKFVKYIVEGTQRMRALLSDLLEYSRIAAYEAPVQAPVDLRAIVQTATANLKAAIEESNATITVDPLPVLQANESHLVALFQNLIENAIKYRGGEPPRIHVSAIETNGELEFAVSDNGIGIDPAYHRKIFGAFQRLHGNSLPGTGIGLAICQRVVERQGGRIWVESTVGHGAKFSFTMPHLQRVQAESQG